MSSRTDGSAQTGIELVSPAIAAQTSRHAGPRNEGSRNSLRNTARSGATLREAIDEHQSSNECYPGDPGPSTGARRRRTTSQNQHPLTNDGTAYPTLLHRAASNESIAVEPTTTSGRPPSFAESQFHTIIRRQRKRGVFTPLQERMEMGLLGASSAVERAASRHNASDVKDQAMFSSQDDNEQDHKGAPLNVGRKQSGPNRPAPSNSYPFAGWGSMSMLEIGSDELEEAKKAVTAKAISEGSLLGQFRAAAIAGNAVVGSIFYALPSVFAAGGVWAPLCFALAALLILPVISVINTLTSALKTANAGSYSYFLNISSRTFALIAGAITLLDAVSAGAVSSTTAATYVSAEAPQVSMTAFSIIFAVALTIICLSGLKDSASLALTMFSLHNLTIVTLLIAGAVSWSRAGNDVLKTNWNDALSVSGSAANLNGKSIARSIFDGTVVAFVGLTGFEMAVSYAGSVKPGAFPKGLRNVWILVALLEAPTALLVTAILPFAKIIEANNILASTAAGIAGRGLQLFVVIDASIVLCGGILTGALSSTGTLLTLAQDGTLPLILSWCVQKTGAPALCFGTFLVLCVAMCGTSSFSQLTVSSVYSIVFLLVLTLFGLAAMMMLYSRPSLPHRKIPLSLVLLSLSITITALAGNVALSPVSLGQTVAYTATLTALLLVWAWRVPLVRIFGVWLPSQIGALKWCLRGLDQRANAWITHSRRRNKAVFLTSSDELSVLVKALRYIEGNEPGIGRVILVHCYTAVEDIPTELESNHQLVDEAFPHITVDLVFVEAPFEAATLHLLASKLGVATSRFYVGCPATLERQEVSDLAGARIIM